MKPLFDKNCCTSNIEFITKLELSFGTHASLPAFGFETAVALASSTSEPFADHPSWKGFELNVSLEINDLFTIWFTIYATSPIDIFLLGQNLSCRELQAGITSFAAKTLISFVHLLAPSSEYLSIAPDKFVVDPAVMALTSIHANWSLDMVSVG